MLLRLGHECQDVQSRAEAELSHHERPALLGTETAFEIIARDKVVARFRKPVLYGVVDIPKTLRTQNTIFVPRQFGARKLRHALPVSFSSTAVDG
jgi:hypothetical protein